jgi:CRISPR-associated exonuclease Cas4
MGGQYRAKNYGHFQTKNGDQYQRIFQLEQIGIMDVTGQLEYPKLRETKEVRLAEEDKTYLLDVIKQIESLLAAETCPPRINSKICKKCSYYDFCYIEEA